MPSRHQRPRRFIGTSEEDTDVVAAAGRSVGILCVPRDGQSPVFTVLSRDAGRTFTTGAPRRLSAPEQIAVSSGSGIAVGNGGITEGGRFDYALALSGNGGRTWRIAIDDHEQVAEDLASGSLQLVTSRDLSWVGYPYFAWQNSDGGRTWHKIPTP